MRKYIEDQLKKTRYCNFSDRTEAKDSIVYNIPKYTKPTYDIGKSYSVRLSDSLMAEDSPVASNWNRGILPISRELTVYVERTAGRMIYVDAVRYCPPGRPASQDMWAGWLPIDELTPIK